MKPFINNAVIGNTRILATLNDKAQILRIFWPNIDYVQQVDKLFLGIYFPSISNTIHWLHNQEWKYVQYYIENTNILRTVITSSIFNIKINITDFVTVNQDVIIRNIEFENMSQNIQNINFCVYCSGMKNNIYESSALFDFESDSTVIFKRNNYMFISSNKECKQFQLTNNPFEACNRLFLYGADDYSLSPEGAMLWELGELLPKEKLSINMYIVFGNEINSTRELCKKVKSTKYEFLFDEAQRYWNDYLSKSKQINTGQKDIDSLYKRSILILKLLSSESGGIIASPEFDEEARMSGKYGFCWPRDGVYVAVALDKAGLTDVSKKFYMWLVKTQDSSGFWYQRYYTNGNIAPSWGLQLDETGTVIWGIWKHYLITNDKNFLKMVWSTVYKAAEYLIDRIDSNTGLPIPTYGIWEEKIGQHVYTSSAVYAGLLSAYKIGKELKKDKDVITKWNNQAQKLKNSLNNNFLHSKRFLRSINVKLNPWGEEPKETNKIVVNKKGYWRNFSKADETVDSSLIGLVVPFEVYEPSDPKIVNIIKQIEDKLFCSNVGGIMRYENDSYVGGNPWVITTLWLASYYIKLKKYDKAKLLLYWVCDHRTKLGLLPEQVDKITGEPSWAIPLSWSHAMFINVLIDLVELKQI